MDRKRCSGCGKVKDLVEFNFRVKATGKRQRYCQDCTRQQLRNHYANNKPYYLRKARKRNNAVKALNRKKVLEYLASHPCVDCGETDVVCLEFDHVRGQKVRPVSAMVGTREWGLIEEEISKCEVRCANCHRRKTAQQIGYYRLIGSSLRP